MSKLTLTVAAVLGVLAAGAPPTPACSAPRISPAPAGASANQARQRIPRGVLDGRLSPLDAAAAFRDLNRRTPALAEPLARDYPADTEGESVCLQVLAWARVELECRRGDSDEPAES